MEHIVEPISNVCVTLHAIQREGTCRLYILTNPSGWDVLQRGGQIRYRICIAPPKGRKKRYFALYGGVYNNIDGNMPKRISNKMLNRPITIQIDT